MKSTLPTSHRLTITVDPHSSVDVIATTEGLILDPDADPAKVGSALLAWVGTARRVALAETETETSVCAACRDNRCGDCARPRGERLTAEGELRRTCCCGRRFV